MTNREFKVGDDVFTIEYGIGNVINITECHVETRMDGVCISYNLNGKKWSSDKRPTLYHLDDALKLFPMWLEEVEDEIETTRWFIYSPRSQTTTNVFTFDTLEKCKERIVYCGSPGDIPVPFQVTEKCKVIREKQK